MSLRPITRRAFASGIAVAAGAALMRNLIQAEGTPEATPAEDETSQLLIRVETIGTMQAAQSFVSVPEFSLFEDGSLYALGPQLAIFPPPALPNLTLTRLSDNGVQALTAAARTAGLDQPRIIEGSMQVADAPITVVTFFDGDQLVTSSAVGLMYLTEAPDEWDEATWESFVELRSIVSLLIGYAGTIDETEILEPERSIIPERLQVIAYTSTNSFADLAGIPNTDQETLVWPLETTLSTLTAEDTGDGIAKSACIELSGSDVRDVIEVANEGNQMSPWADRGAGDSGPTYGVLFKPLLPDQSACGF